MKKIITAVGIFAILLMAILTMTVSAESGSFRFCGLPLDESSYGDIFSDGGSVKYIPAEKSPDGVQHLILTDAGITVGSDYKYYYTAAIEFGDGNAVIELNGESEINVSHGSCIRTDGYLTFTGDGSLTLKKTDADDKGENGKAALYARYGVGILSGTVRLDSDTVGLEAGNLSFGYGGRLTACGEKKAVHGLGSVRTPEGYVTVGGDEKEDRNENLTLHTGLLGGTYCYQYSDGSLNAAKFCDIASVTEIGASVLAFEQKVPEVSAVANLGEIAKVGFSVYELPDSLTALGYSVKCTVTCRKNGAEDTVEESIIGTVCGGELTFPDTGTYPVTFRADLIDAGGKTVCAITDYVTLTVKSECTHDWAETRCTATCETDGIRYYTCRKCGAGREEPAAATESHKAGGEWYHDREKCWQVCTVCGKRLEEAAHTFEVKEKITHCAGTETYYICTRCGSEKLEKSAEKAGHLFTEWHIGADKHWRVCRICGYNETGNHTFADDECTVCGYKKPTYELTGSNCIHGSLTYTFKTDGSGKDTYEWYMADDVQGRNRQLICSTDVPTLSLTEYAGVLKDKYVQLSVTRKSGMMTSKIRTGFLKVYGPEIMEVTGECEGKGTIRYQFCTLCGQMYDMNGKPITSTARDTAVAHSYTDDCDEMCNVCGKLRTAPHVLAGEWSSDDTFHYHICSSCGLKVDLGVHTESEWKYKTTTSCTETGGRYKVCTVCGKKLVEESLTDSHEYGEWQVTAPTCTQNGVKTRTCAKCGATESVILEATGHIFEYHGAVAGTCMTEGTPEYRRCTGCGILLEGAEGENELTGVPTGTKDAANHIGGILDFDETTHYTVCACGEILDRTEHTYEDGRCTVCGYEENHVHAYTGWKYDETGHIGLCRCGKTDPEAKMQPHTYDSENKCTVCGFVKRSDILYPTVDELPEEETTAESADETTGPEEDPLTEEKKMPTWAVVTIIVAAVGIIAAVAVIFLRRNASVRHPKKGKRG